MSNINQQFHDTLNKRKEETEQKLEALNKRITDLDKYFEEQKAAILKYIDDRGEELTKLLNQFKVIRGVPSHLHVCDSHFECFFVFVFQRPNSKRIAVCVWKEKRLLSSN